MMTVKTVSFVTVGGSATMSLTTKSMPIVFAAVVNVALKADAKAVVSLRAVSTAVASLSSVVYSSYSTASFWPCSCRPAEDWAISFSLRAATNSILVMLTLEASTPKLPAIAPSIPATNILFDANSAALVLAGNSKATVIFALTVKVVTFSRRVVVDTVVVVVVVTRGVVVVEVVVPDWQVGNPERVPRVQETVASEISTSTFSGPHVTLTELPERMSSP